MDKKLTIRRRKPNRIRVLVACEFSGVVRDAFIEKGFDAMSCDLLPTESSGPHYTGNVLDILGDGWDLMIAHPPCTYLCASGMNWTVRGYRDPQLTEDALDFVVDLLNAPIRSIALENPVGVISTRVRPADQYIQPYQFGHDVSKKTGLWLKDLPLLEPTGYITPLIVEGKKRWSNQAPSGADKTSPGPDRWKIRSKTYQGIADAMADQWGRFVKEQS